MKSSSIAYPLLLALVLFTTCYTFADDFKTLDGTVYRKANILRIEPDCLVVEIDSGVERIPFTNLSPALQKKYGYDPTNAAAYHSSGTPPPPAIAPPLQASRMTSQVEPTGTPIEQLKSRTQSESKDPNLAQILEEKKEFVLTNPVAGLITLVVFIFIISGMVNYVKMARQRAHRRKLIKEAKDFLITVGKANMLSSVSTNLLLKDGEKAFYDDASSLYETRAVRHYQSGRASFRVAKGVWIGGSQGRSVSSQEWTKIDDGILTITSKRIVFTGEHDSRNLLLSKINGVSEWSDAVEISVENRQKAVVLSGVNPFLIAAIIRLLCDQ